MKIKFFASMLLFVLIINVSCSNDDKTVPQENLTFNQKNITAFDKVGIVHNEGLDFIFSSENLTLLYEVGIDENGEIDQ